MNDAEHENASYVYYEYVPKDHPSGRGCRHERPGCQKTCPLGSARNPGGEVTCSAYVCTWKIYDKPSKTVVSEEIPRRDENGQYVFNDGRRVISDGDNTPPTFLGGELYGVLTHPSIAYAGELYQGFADDGNSDRVPSRLNGLVDPVKISAARLRSYQRYLAMPDADFELLAMEGIPAEHQDAMKKHPVYKKARRLADEVV